MVRLSKRQGSSSWFPLRIESLSKPKHHIVHASIQDGIDRLADYLRTEEEINRKSAEHSTSRTDSIIALYESEPSTMASNDSNSDMRMSAGDAELRDAVSMLSAMPSPASTHAEPEAAEIAAERDELERLLFECIGTSEAMARQHEDGRQELSYECQSLRDELHRARAEHKSVLDKHHMSLARTRELEEENTRLQGLVQMLQGDVAVAERRNAQIKDHAQLTIDRANAEIARLHACITQAHKDAAAMQARTAQTATR
ncbi:hypothetical protein IWW50_005124, partial [Coemansia erecta]